MYELTHLFIYRPIFMAQLIVAELIFLCQLNRRSRFPLRLTLAIVGCFAISFAIPLPNIAYTAWYTSIMFIVMFGVTVGAFCLVFAASPTDILFCTVAGYTVQHVSQEMFEFLNILFNFSGDLSSVFYGPEPIAERTSTGFIGVFIMVFTYLAIYLVVYWTAYLLFAKAIKRFNILKLKTGVMITAAAAAVVLDVVVSALITYTIPDDTAKLAVCMLHVYNIVSCVLAFVLLFEWPKRKGLEGDIATLKSLRHNEQEQYRISKENIDRINIKCHDLKHQVRELGERKSVDGSVIGEIASLISIYESTYKTKNEALNVILTEKSLICNDNKIRFSCVADGECISFIAAEDIYSMFGNLLDNAIEAVIKLPEERRSIGLSIKTVNSLVIINIYNFFAGEIKFDGDLPVTSKSDSDMHGFGLRSVKYTAEKYGGEVSMRTDGDTFYVNIVMPAKRADARSEIAPAAQ